jgi:hypothetical protein
MDGKRERLADRADMTVSLDSRLLGEVEAAFAAAADRAATAARELGSGSALGDRFEAGLRAVLEFAAERSDTTRLCLVEAPGLGTQAVERKEAGLQRFVDLLDADLARANDGQAPPLVAEMVVGGVYEVLQRAARAGDYASMPGLAGQLRDLWLPALRTH